MHLATPVIGLYIRRFFSLIFQNWCHQTSDFKVKMHQICLSLGFRPRPVEELTELPGPLAVFEESTSKRRERGEGRMGRK